MDGVVDLKQDNDQKIDELNNEIGLHTAPIIAKDTIIVGAAHIEGSAPRHYQAVIGNVCRRAVAAIELSSTSVLAPRQIGSPSSFAAASCEPSLVTKRSTCSAE